MFRTIGDGPAAWELALPAEVLWLPEELARVDALLDDAVFLAPFAPHFHPALGRPSTPMEWYLRLMFLKFRHGLGYESLCAEVSDSISWRRLCRIPLDGMVPHPTTLMKLTRRCGEGAVAGLNEALWAKTAGQKLVRTARLVQASGGATGTKMTDRRRAATRQVREIASKLRARGKLARDESSQVIRRVTGELADLAEQTAAQAAAVVRNGCLRRRPIPLAAAGHRAAMGKLLRRGSACGRGVQAAGLVAGCRYRCPGVAGAPAWRPRAADRPARGRVPDRALVRAQRRRQRAGDRRPVNGNAGVPEICTKALLTCLIARCAHALGRPVLADDRRRLQKRDCAGCTHRRNRFLLDPGLYMTHNPRHE